MVDEFQTTFHHFPLLLWQGRSSLNSLSVLQEERYIHVVKVMNLHLDSCDS